MVRFARVDGHSECISGSKCCHREASIEIAYQLVMTSVGMQIQLFRSD